MSDEAIKQQIRRAKKAAIEKCRDMGYKTIISDNSLFCFLAVRRMEIRMIRVIIDDVSDKEIQQVRKFEPPGVCSKEIWRWQTSRKFEIIEIN